MVSTATPPAWANCSIRYSTSEWYQSASDRSNPPPLWGGGPPGPEGDSQERWPRQGRGRGGRNGCFAVPGRPPPQPSPARGEGVYGVEQSGPPLAGRSPRVTDRSTVPLPRSAVILTVSPGLCSCSTPPSVSPLFRSMPSIRSITSLLWIPPLSAGEPGSARWTTMPKPLTEG